MNTCIGVVLAGGQGARLWPLSTPDCPKQFIARNNNATLFNRALRHAYAVTPHVYISTQKKFEHFFTNEVPSHQVIMEPASKNTAAAIVLAAYHIAQNYPDATLFFLPSDHAITSADQFKGTLEKAIVQAQTTHDMVLIGARPTFPSTQYGYITSLDSRVTAFVEKPTNDRAREFMKRSDMWWNTGLVIARVHTIMREAEKHVPHILTAVKDLIDNGDDKLFLALPSQSFDYAVLEKQTSLSMVPAEFTWSDAGSLEQFIAAHEIKTDHHLIWSSKKVILHDVEELCVIETDDMILITPRRQAATIYELKETM